MQKVDFLRGGGQTRVWWSKAYRAEVLGLKSQEQCEIPGAE